MDKKDLEKQLEYWIRASADPRTHSDPRNKKIVEDKIAELVEKLKKLEVD